MSDEDNLFGELDIASANDNPFFKPDDTYICLVTAAQVRTSKKGNKGLALDYTIQEGPKQGKKIQEWLTVPKVWELKGYETKEDAENQTNHSDKIQENAERFMSFLKRRMKTFGIPAEEMNSITPEKLLNLGWVSVTIKNVDGRENITNLELTGASSEADPFA